MTECSARAFSNSRKSESVIEVSLTSLISAPITGDILFIFMVTESNANYLSLIFLFVGLLFDFSGAKS